MKLHFVIGIVIFGIGDSTACFARDYFTGAFQSGMEQGAASARESQQQEYELERQRAAQAHELELQRQALELEREKIRKSKAKNEGSAWFVADSNYRCAPSEDGMTFSKYTTKLKKRQIKFDVSKVEDAYKIVIRGKKPDRQIWADSFEACDSAEKADRELASD